MITKEQLGKIGLPDNQAKIYLSLLQEGPQFLQEISKNTEIKRTSLYLVIDQMSEKGLIDVEIIGKRKRYCIKNPQKLLSKIKEQYYLLDALMPQLEDILKQNSAENKIKFYNTKTGLKETLKEIATLNNEKDELLTIEGDINSAFNLGYDFWKNLLAEKKKMGIKSRTIIPSHEKNDFIIRDHKIQVRTSAMFDDFNIMLYLFFNKVVVIIPEDSLCIVIENIKIKKALTAMFEVIWRRSKPYFKN